MSLFSVLYKNYEKQLTSILSIQTDRVGNTLRLGSFVNTGHKNRPPLFLGSEQTTLWHADLVSVGISLCGGRPQQTCRRRWYDLASLAVSAAGLCHNIQPQAHRTCHCHYYRSQWQHTSSDCLTLPIKRRPRKQGQGRSQTLPFAQLWGSRDSFQPSWLM